MVQIRKEQPAAIILPKERIVAAWYYLFLKRHSCNAGNFMFPLFLHKLKHSVSLDLLSHFSFSQVHMCGKHTPLSLYDKKPMKKNAVDFNCYHQTNELVGIIESFFSKVLLLFCFTTN